MKVQRKGLAGILMPALLVISLVLPSALTASAQDIQTGPIVIPEQAHAVTPPVREMASVAPRAAGQGVALPVRHRAGPPIVSLKPDSVVQQLSSAPLVRHHQPA